MITAEGGDAFGQILMQGDNVIVPAGGNFYVGLCNQIPVYDDTLTDITTEPSSAGGYARIPLARNSTDWPTIQLVNGEILWQSKVFTFTASGADFSTAYSRLFLCTVASGTAGLLFAISGSRKTPVTLLDGQSDSVTFELYP